MPKKLQQNPGPLARLFNSAAAAQIIDHFTLMDDYEYSKTEIAEASEVSLRTVIRTIPLLEKYGLIQHTRSIGQAEMYRTNKDNPIIQHLQKTVRLIADIDINEELAVQQKSAKQQADAAVVQEPEKVPA